MEPPRGKSICVPFDNEEYYAACVADPESFRQHLTEIFGQHPELFPASIDEGFVLHDKSWSRTRWLRVIRLIQESGKMAPHYTMLRGHCHDSAPRVLPAGRHRIPLVMYHAALYLAEPKCGVPSAANGTRTHQV